MALTLRAAEHYRKTIREGTFEDRLFRILQHMDYKVVYEDLRARKLKGYCWPAKGLIGLDKFLNPIEHKCTLSEETGHALYPPLQNTVKYHQKSYWSLDANKRSEVSYFRAQNERPGLVWATSVLILDFEFWEFANKGPWEWWEWLERFEVTEDIMHWKIGFMRTKQRFMGRDIIKRVPPQGGF